MKQMKKISDFLIDLKVPVTEKEKVLLLLSGDEVMWVMGYRIDNRFRVTDHSGKILVLTVMMVFTELVLLHVVTYLSLSPFIALSIISRSARPIATADSRITGIRLAMHASCLPVISSSVISPFSVSKVF